LRSVKEKGRSTVAARDPPERDWASRWGIMIEAVKVIGGLIAAFAALLEYASHNEEQRAETILRAVQIIESNSTEVFRRNLKTLVAQFYTAEAWVTYWPNRDKKDDLVIDFIENKIMSKYDQEFKTTLTFFDVMYDFGSTNTCNWKLIVSAFERDAGDFYYYFDIYFEGYAARIHTSPEKVKRSIVFLTWGAYPDPRAEPCEAGGSPTLVRRVANWIKRQL
jgi:hypothetical protein